MQANLPGYIIGSFKKQGEAALIFVESALEDPQAAFTEALSSNNKFTPQNVEEWGAAPIG